jgi:hypothetical protein
MDLGKDLLVNSLYLYTSRNIDSKLHYKIFKELWDGEIVKFKDNMLNSLFINIISFDKDSIKDGV